MQTLSPDLLTEASGIHFPDLQRCVEAAGGYWKIDWAEFDAAYVRARAMLLNGSKYLYRKRKYEL